MGLEEVDALKRREFRDEVDFRLGAIEQLTKERERKRERERERERDKQKSTKQINIIIYKNEGMYA